MNSKPLLDKARVPEAEDAGYGSRSSRCAGTSRRNQIVCQGRQRKHPVNSFEHPFLNDGDFDIADGQPADLDPAGFHLSGFPWTWTADAYQVDRRATGTTRAGRGLPIQHQKPGAAIEQEAQRGSVIDAGDNQQSDRGSGRKGE